MRDLAIVKDYYNGSTHIMIDDTYCKGKTKDDPEVKAAMEKIAGIAVENYRATMNKDKKDE